jgi:GNAT superfamily N-acetyltransferase
MTQTARQSPVVVRAFVSGSEDLRFSLDAVDALLMRAYALPSRRARIERFLATEPNGFAVATIDGQLVGAGGSIGYPTGGFGWIGLIGTDPTVGRRGVGRAITNWLVDYLRSTGCASVLDGSEQGAPLYERMGFGDHGRSVQLLLPTTRIGDLADGCRIAVEADLDEVFLFDAPRFGADRSRLLRYLFYEFPYRMLVHTGATGSVDGFGFAADTTIGPVVADTEDATRALLLSLCTFSFGGVPVMIMPSETRYFDLATSIGFIERRVLRHQRLGIATLPGRRELLVAQCSFGEG